jgi:nicotinate-nucleotide--dimethylbenzimidazole phosphoribosyltransferase
VTLLAETIAHIVPADRSIAARTQALLDQKTKPRRSLGRLEDLACRIAAARGEIPLALPRKAIVVMAADHGVAVEGVSAYPQEVTRQMVLNFARGGAGINVLARQAGARVVVVDMGVKESLGATEGVRVSRMGPGTCNFLREPAMTRDQATAAIEVGIRLAAELAGEGVDLLGIGEMGIGNTTAASALAAVFTGTDPAEVTGRGTGVDDAALARKVEVVRRALALHRPDGSDALDALAKVGGFEIAGLAGVVLGSAARRVPVIADGFISSTAALAAVRLVPAAAGYLIASHRSVEPGHRKVLEAIGVPPLLDLDLRLGEGTGAALAMHLAEASIRVLLEMATFDSAGVSDSGS